MEFIVMVRVVVEAESDVEAEALVEQMLNEQDGIVSAEAFDTEEA